MHKSFIVKSKLERGFWHLISLLSSRGALTSKSNSFQLPFWTFIEGERERETRQLQKKSRWSRARHLIILHGFFYFSRLLLLLLFSSRGWQSMRSIRKWNISGTRSQSGFYGFRIRSLYVIIIVSCRRLESVQVAHSFEHMIFTFSSAPPPPKIPTEQFSAEKRDFRTLPWKTRSLVQ